MKRRNSFRAWLKIGSCAAAAGLVFQTVGCTYSADNLLPTLFGAFANLAISDFVNGVLNVSGGFSF